MRKQLFFIGFLFFATVFSCKQETPNTTHSSEVNIEEEKEAFKDLVPAFAKPAVNPQQNIVPKIHPPNWWVGMENSTVQVMLHGLNVGSQSPKINTPGVVLKDIRRVENPNYLFLDLDISKAKPGKIPIVLSGGSVASFYEFELLERTNNPEHVQGLSPKDVIYLIMPDRFANGDASNDSVAEMTQTGTDRNKVLSRHGGDLQGIIDQLDYLQNLGVTALWLNPVQTNDEPYESYHGYAITDHYSIDPRLGTNELYVTLVNEAHKRGMKVVMDIIQNHVGHNHHFIQDLPRVSWLNSWDEFTRTTYRAPALLDPYASKSDMRRMSDGWFDNHMPDLNQRDPLLAKYLIQNTIWWVEQTGLDGFRIDTYAYPDVDFSKTWMNELLGEYEQLGVFAETWVHGIPIQNYFIEETGVPGVTDFQLYYAINDALNNEQGWTEGIAKVYYTLAQDREYKDPWKNVIFLDNHDLARFTTTVNGDMDKWKQGITFLLTSRGIPMITYGTEHFMQGAGGGFGEGGRKDFPGGWPDDDVNKFNPDNLKGKEKEAFNYLFTLLNYRKNSLALSEGSLLQFIPENGVYVYFRQHEGDVVMVVLNASDKRNELDLSRFSEAVQPGATFKNVLTDEVLQNTGNLSLSPRQSLILEVN